MAWFIKAFIRASLVWLFAGTLAGVLVALVPGWVVYRPVHAHLTATGFLGMLVFGVGYQLLPRLFGHPLHSSRLAALHYYAANAGLLSLVVGFVVRVHAPGAGTLLLGVGGLTFLAGVVAFCANLWRTFDAADERERLRRQGNGHRLPTLDG